MQHNRLLVGLNKTIKDINRETINPRVEELEMDDLTPVIEMVARARADYLQGFFDLSKEVGEGTPTTDHIKRLRHLRLIYEELLSASTALEVAIERGYLDVAE